MASEDSSRVTFDGVERFVVSGDPNIMVTAFTGDAPFIALQIGHEHDGRFSLILRDIDRARSLSDALLAAIAFTRSPRSTA